MLIVVRRGPHGRAYRAGRARASPTPEPSEFAAWAPLVALTVVAGLWPKALLGLTDPAVQQLLAGGTRMSTSGPGSRPSVVQFR